MRKLEIKLFLCVICIEYKVFNRYCLISIANIENIKKKICKMFNAKCSIENVFTKCVPSRPHVLFAAFTEEKLFHRNCNCQGIMHIFLFSKFTVANLLGPSLVASIKSIFKRNKTSFLSPRKQSKILNYF